MVIIGVKKEGIGLRGWWQCGGVVKKVTGFVENLWKA
jgi:hypothetical protein